MAEARARRGHAPREATLRAARVLLGLAAFAGGAPASSAEKPSAAGAALAEVVVTGTRARDRTVLDSPAPVDVFGAEALRATAAVASELGQALAVLAPSFNFPRQSNSGTSDHVRAGQLRGLSPDQLLVLVNGKRRHLSAIVNSETKIGRGTSAVDFNTIPLGAVKRIEVLRDGAGALYGSDAIAGVVNVILDDAPRGVGLDVTYGFHRTHEGAIGTTLTDGETLTATLEGGVPLGQEGFLRAGAGYVSRNGTERAGFDEIPFFVPQTPANLARRGLRNYAEGDPSVEGRQLWLNAAVRGRRAEWYGFATLDRRESEGATFFRYPDGPDNLREIYPEGFLPRTVGESNDLAVTAGARFELAGWALDASVGHGRNEFTYGVIDSLNASLGPASPTAFHSGAYELAQAALNADAWRRFDAVLPAGALTLAAGAEVRRERFASRAGDPASYQAGPFDLAIGAQGAPGLTPADEADQRRTVYGLYGSASGQLTARLFAEGAVRFDEYADFGGELTGKLAGLYRVGPHFALRGTVSSSVRAPSLPQVGFADRTVNFGANRTLVITRTAPVPIARALGARDLEAETARNLSFGATGRLGTLQWSIDAFQVWVDERIVLSERFFGEALEAFVQGLPGGTGVQSVRFFANAVDTRTRGVDVVADVATAALGGRLGATAAYSYAETQITRFAPTPAALLALDPGFRLVGVEEINTIEEAAPRSQLVLTTTWARGPWSALGRLSRYGSAVRVFNFGGGFEPRQRYGAELAFDAQVSWALSPRASLTLGGANLFDEYPDRSRAEINFFGNLPYDILSPVGVNGRYLYLTTRISL